jgi:hypothetical protein
MRNVPERALLDSLAAHRVGAARQLLADIDALDHSDTHAAYTLLGRAQVVIGNLADTIEGEGQR